MIGYWGTNIQRRARDLRRMGYHVTSRTRCAVRFAALTDCTITDAAHEFSVNPGAVWNAWERTYPGVPHPKRTGL
jgi:hypothetical protein